MNTSTSPVALVESLYAAFGRGDIATILGALSTEVDWRGNVDRNAPGADRVVMFRPRQGRTAVQQFFVDLGTTVELHAFTPQSFMSNATEVAVHVTLEFTVRATGRRMAMAAIHHWTFGTQGKVIRFTDYFDTLGEAAAWDAVQAR
ncbi:MAG: nuclear transport factor 2 family protein [Verrucomicrobiota bacterium]